MLKILHRPETVAMQDGCVILHYTNDFHRQETFDFLEHYGASERNVSPNITSHSPSLSAVEAAIKVCNTYGIDIHTPDDGDMDDAEWEKYNALCEAIAAAYAVDSMSQHSEKPFLEDRFDGVTKEQLERTRKTLQSLIDDDADYHRPDSSGYSRADEEWFFDVDGKP